MLYKYCVLTILFVTIIRSDATEVACTPGVEPQLSTTFLNGYWYEHLYTQTTLNNKPCAHFHIKCNSNTSSCEVQNVIWNSYLLEEIWNGTIVQKDNVELTINGDKNTSTYTVNLKFQDRAVLIWVCNDVHDTLEFASVLIRMDDDEEMEEVWGDAAINMDYLGIAEQFPAGIWKKIDPKGCGSDGRTILSTFSPKLLLALLLLMPII